MDKITREEFDERFEILADGPKTINSGKINVMFNMFEMFIRSRVSGIVEQTGTSADSLDDGKSMVYSQYCN